MSQYWSLFIKKAEEKLATIGLKAITISAVVTRADGTVEDLGVLARQEY